MHFNLRDPQTYFDFDTAKLYHSQATQLHWKGMCAELVRKLGVNNKDRVLEIGSGSGVGTRTILQRNPRLLYTVEPSAAMIHLSNKYLTRTEKRKIIATHGNLDDFLYSDHKKITKICSFGVYVVLPNPNDHLKQVYQAFPDVPYAFSVENWADAHVGELPIAEYNRLIEEAAKALKVPIVLNTTPIGTYSIDEVTLAVEQSGANVQSVDSIPMEGDPIKMKDYLGQSLTQSGAQQELKNYMFELIGTKPFHQGDIYLFVTQ